MEKYILSVFLLLSISGAASAVTLVNGALGGSVHFDVTVPSQATGSIQWIFKSQITAQYLPGTSPICVPTLAGRCQMFVNGSLILNKIEYNDEGEYTLTAYNNALELVISVIYNLKVYANLTAPVLRTNNTNNPLMSGTNVTLQCDAGNQNVTTYTFYHGQNMICSQPNVTCRGSFLDFTPISENDTGFYTCIIQNPVSNSTSNSLSLAVFAPVSNVVVTNNISGLVWPGLDSVSLQCSAHGTDVSYSWSLQGASITGGGRFSLADNNTKLIISPVSSTDNGSFICTAKNILNSRNSSDVKLNLASPVSAVALTSNTSGVLWAGEDSVSLYCSAQGSDITFSWKLNGNQVSQNPTYNITQSASPPTSNLTISPVSKNDIGPFTCTASNRANNMTSNATNFNINWSPDGNILCTAVANPQGVRLGCSWTGGKPAANVTQIFNGVQNTSTDQVFRNETTAGNIQGSNLTCNGNQLGRTSSCVLTFAPPTSDHKNDSTTSVTVGDPVVLTVNLTSVAQSRAISPASQVLPATFSWYRGGVQITQNVVSSDYASTFKINEVSVADSGTYECKATNFIGSATFRFNVDVSKQANPPNNGLSGGAIAGIVIGVLAGVTLIGIIVFFILKKKKRSSKDGRINDPDDQTATVHYAEINKPKQTNGGVAEIGMSNNSFQEDKDDVKYAEIKFPKSSSTTSPTTPPVETVYSDVKNASKT